MAEPESGLTRHQSTVDEKDEELLAELGYKQELRRDWGLLHNFGISFSIIVCSQCTLLFSVNTMNVSRSSPVLQLCSNMVSLPEALEVGFAPEAQEHGADCTSNERRVDCCISLHLVYSIEHG